MFDVIAPRYDAFTRLFSFGMDAGWKREALDAAVRACAGTGRRPEVALDLACGTGDLAFGVARRLSDARVLGLDASRRMVAAAQARRHGADRDVAGRVRVAVGDMMALPVPDGAADLVTVGYGVRNAPDGAQAVREAARVLRPGGHLVSLDFHRPASAAWRRLFLGYLLAAGNVVGWWWHRDPVVYGYIARSIDHFLSWQAFVALLEGEGFRVTGVRRWLGGGVARIVAQRR
jgi:demethylmenaquinone methyltransferase/2-methoxy-6-polyprenyl-1,4-benzoquinol methylase